MAKCSTSLLLVFLVVISSSAATVVARAGVGSGGYGHHGNYSPGRGGYGGRIPAVTWHWRCSNEQDMLPTTDPAAFQRQILKGLGDARFLSGNVVGCDSQAFTPDNGDGSGELLVYSIFNCPLNPSDKCSACFNDAVKELQDGCPGRAGAVFTDDVTCCLRYELYNFCPNTCSV